MNLFRKFKAMLQLREAIKKADNAHAATGERFFVMPTTDGKLLVMDRRNFRKLKFKNYVKRNVVINNLLTESFYFTPCRGERLPMAEDLRKKKVKQFFEWKELFIKKQKAQKKAEQTQRTNNRNNPTGITRQK